MKGRGGGVGKEARKNNDCNSNVFEGRRGGGGEKRYRRGGSGLEGQGGKETCWSLNYPREPNAAIDRARNTMDIAHPI